MNDTNLEVALAGYGLAGSVFHGPLIAATPGLALTAIVTRNDERAAAARERHPDAAVVASVDAALATGPDVLVVATPNRSHADAALAAIAAGVAVVVDKPLAVTAAQGRGVVEAAQAAGVPLTVFHNRRWDGDFLTVRRLREQGELGTVHRFESRFERFRPQIKEGWREQGDPAQGGGTLLDLGPHLVDQAIVLFGAPVRVHAEVRTLREGARVDDDAFLALEHPGGVVSHLWASAVAAAPGPRYRVLGARAAYVKDGLDVQEDALRDGSDPGAPGWGTEPPDRWGRLLHGDAGAPFKTLPGDYGRFYALLRDALNEGAPLPVDPADAVVVLEVLEAALARADT